MAHYKSMHFRVFFALLLAALFLVGIGASMVHAGNDGGQAIEFTGRVGVVKAPLNWSDKVVLPPLPPPSVTVEMWVRPLAGDDSGIFQWARRLTAPIPYIYFHYNAETLYFYVDNGNRAPTSLPIGMWAHIATTYDGTTWRFYKNGDLVGTYVGGAEYLIDAIDVYFGNGYGDGINGFWTGQIDEARIWDVARTQSEIQAGMYGELGASPTGLIAYYRFNSTSGITATDSAPGGLHPGTLYTMTDSSWITATAPLGNLLPTYQNGTAAMWAGQTSTAADSITTGLDIANVGFLNDLGDDIIFGHNNAAFANVTTDVPAGVDKRWARVWELDTNDAAGTTGGNVNLTFDISDAGGQGNFSGTGTYSLLRRPSGSSTPFAIVPVVGTSVAGDQVTFTVDVSNLGSEFTLGATSDSPTALSLQSVSAHTNGVTLAALPLAALLIAGGVALAWRRRRSMQ